MKPTKKQKILNTISEIRNSHSEMVNIFSAGSCLNFFMILRSIYQEAIPYYNIDHIITRIGDTYYDINGVVLDIRGYIPFSECYGKRGTRRAFNQMYRGEYQIGKK